MLQEPRLGGAFGVATLALAMLLGGCRQDVAFTRVPGTGVVERSVPASEVVVFHSVPVDVGSIKDAAGAAIAPQLAKWRAFLDDIACDKHNGPWVQCMGATVSAEIVRAGAIDILLEGGRLVVVVPVKYDITAKGHGWSSYLTDHKTGSTEVRIPLEVSLGGGYRLDVRVAGEPVWADKVVPILKGKIVLAESTNAKIKADIKAAADPLRKALAETPTRTAAANAWRALHSPIALMRAPNLWLRGEPTRVASGGFVTENGAIVYRIGVGSRVTVHQGNRPQPMPVKPLPEPVLAVASDARSRLALSVDVSNAALTQAIVAVFPAGELIETRADIKATPVKVLMRGVSLLPAMDRLVVELKLEVVEPLRMAGIAGSAYFVTRPVLKPETGSLELDEIAFPAGAQKEAKETKSLADVVRIGEEPFAGRLYTASRLDLGREIQALLPRINATLAQPLDDAMTLSGTFETITASAIEPRRDAFRVHLELSGSLTVALPANQVHSAASMRPTGSSGPHPQVPTERK